MRRRWIVGLGTLSVIAAVVGACVGDDPSTGTDSTTDGGGTDTSVTPPTDTGGGGNDSATENDAGGVDACANIDAASDPKNCGVCGHDCMHGACSSGVCQPWMLTSVDGGLHGPGTDGTFVFYSIDDVVWRIQTDGGSAVAMVNGLGGRAFAQSANGMLTCGAVNGDAGVYRLPVNPGASATKVHDVAACTALVVDGTSDWAGRVTTVDEVTPTTTRSQTWGVFNERLTGGMAINGPTIFWTNQNGGVYRATKAAIDAGRSVVNADAINEPTGLAVSDSRAYVTARPAGGGGVLLSVELDGGASGTLLTNIEQPKLGTQHVAHAPNGALYFAAGSTLYGLVPPP